MSHKERHIQYLLAAELQFRLASAVSIATTKRGETPQNPPTFAMRGSGSATKREMAGKVPSQLGRGAFPKRHEGEPEEAMLPQHLLKATD